jgi:hypothetical protein
MPSSFSGRCRPVGTQPEKCGHRFRAQCLNATLSWLAIMIAVRKNTGLLNATAAAEVVKGCVVLPQTPH